MTENIDWAGKCETGLVDVGSLENALKETDAFIPFALNKGKAVQRVKP